MSLAAHYGGRSGCVTCKCGDSQLFEVSEPRWLVSWHFSGHCGRMCMCVRAIRVAPSASSRMVDPAHVKASSGSSRAPPSRQSISSACRARLCTCQCEAGGRLCLGQLEEIFVPVARQRRDAAVERLREGCERAGRRGCGIAMEGLRNGCDYGCGGAAEGLWKGRLLGLGRERRVDERQPRVARTAQLARDKLALDRLCWRGGGESGRGVGAQLHGRGGGESREPCKQGMASSMP